jgi:hypothetical protein
VFVDADHARDKVTRRSVTGIIVFINNTPVKWYCKRQRTVETSTYGSELVAARIAVEVVMEVRYMLRMLGVAIEETSILIGDNLSVLLNTTVPSSVLKKKHLGCSYHRVREAVAGGIIRFCYTPSNCNFADVLTKPLPVHSFQNLVKPWLFRQAKVIEEEVAKQIRMIKMATRIPTDEEQDEDEEMMRIRSFLNEFHRQLDVLRDIGRYKECIKEVLKHIKTIPQPERIVRSDGVVSWRLVFILMRRRIFVIDGDSAIRRYPLPVAFASNMYKMPLEHEYWRWSVSGEYGLLPFQILGIEDPE